MQTPWSDVGSTPSRVGYSDLGWNSLLASLLDAIFVYIHALNDKTYSECSRVFPLLFHFHALTTTKFMIQDSRSR